MIRVSIEMPNTYNYRFKPLIDNQAEFLKHGVLVDYRLPTADLRILHNAIAAEELKDSPNRRLRSPTIVYERADSAVIMNAESVRNLMKHSDVKLWLKRNTFRDYRLNNENFLAGRQHYVTLNNTEKFHMGFAAGEPQRVLITEAMARKIRPLPIAGIDLFSNLRNADIDWSAKRPIDVSFVGLVDYELRGTDYWDGNASKLRTNVDIGFEELVDKHRREAVRQLIEMKHLRILVGMNRAVQADLYGQVMLRSSITVSPWGFGEYAYRDYEAILAGSILIKPHSDHIATFAPDIYQANKYYVPCAADFSDLREVIISIMSDRKRAIERARTAREALLSANTNEKLVEYFLGLFREALEAPALESQEPLIGLGIMPPSVVRGTLEKRIKSLDEKGDKLFVFSDDQTEKRSHDIRLIKNDVWPAGVYRVRCVLRRVGQRHMGISVHHMWKDGVAFGVDLDTGEVAHHDVKGTGFSMIQEPEIEFGEDHWITVSALIRIDQAINGRLFLMLYSAKSNREFYYTGMGEPCFHIAALDLTVANESNG